MRYNIDDNFLEQVKNKYYELYLAILILGNKNFIRQITILKVFVELNTIPQKVKEKTMGYIRLIWWRDALLELKENKVRNHPLIQALAYLNEVEFNYFNKITEAIEFDLEDHNTTDIQTYFKEKYNSLFDLILIPINQQKIFEEFLFSFSIVIDILIHKRNNLFDKLEFFAKRDNMCNIKYTEALIAKSVQNLKMFSLDPLYKKNLSLYLLSKAIFYYASKFKEVNYDIYNFDYKNYRVKLMLNLYINSLIFKFKSIANKLFAGMRFL